MSEPYYKVPVELFHALVDACGDHSGQYLGSMQHGSTYYQAMRIKDNGPCVDKDKEAGITYPPNARDAND